MSCCLFWVKTGLIPNIYKRKYILNKKNLAVNKIRFLPCCLFKPRINQIYHLQAAKVATITLNTCFMTIFMTFSFYETTDAPIGLHCCHKLLFLTKDLHLDTSSYSWLYSLEEYNYASQIYIPTFASQAISTCNSKVKPHHCLDIYIGSITVYESTR